MKKNEVCFLAALLMSLAIIQGQAASLYFAPAADDNNNFWDNDRGWKDNSGFVNHLPTDADDVTLNAAKIALAGQGIESPHALRITNGVKAVAKTVKIATLAASNDSSYTKTGRVIGLQIEEGGFLHTLDIEGSFSIGDSSAGYGVLTMTGGMISNHAVTVGYAGIGVMTNAGGTVMLRSQNSVLMLGRNAGSKGTLVMTGGLLRHDDWNYDTNHIAVGQSGQGVFELSGGVVSNKILVGVNRTGRGSVKMSGGHIVNRVFVGVESTETNEFDFSGGEITGHLYVGHGGRGRMTFDGGVHSVYKSIPIPKSVLSYGLVIGNKAGSIGNLIVKKPGLAFYNNSELICGYRGEGHVETFVDLEIPYLRLGGNTDAMNSYAAYAATTTSVSQAAYIGGYLIVSNLADSSSENIVCPGRGELLLSNAVLRLTRYEAGVTTPQLYLGRFEGSFGILRGCGAVHGKVWNANAVRMAMGRGQIIGDGFGEQRTLDLNTVISVTNMFVNADDGTNGWYAVNKGAVLFPRTYLSTASDSRIIGTWNRNASPDFVNSVGFSVSGVPSPSNGYDMRGGVYATDRDDVHVDALPHGSIVGIWKLGLFTDVTGFSPKSFENMDLTFRYDHTKVERNDLLNLYRWNGSAWTRVASSKATENPRISCSGLAPVAGETYNVGTFALMCRKTKGFRMVIR